VAIAAIVSSSEYRLMRRDISHAQRA